VLLPSEWVRRLVLRVGIVGFATHLHSRAFLREPRTKLVAAAEENMKMPKWLKEGEPFVESIGLELIPSYEKLLERPDIDAVSINTETHLKPSLVELAAKNGKHVMVDKPMARNVADAKKMIKAVKESGVVLLIQYPTRFDPLFEKVLEESASGGIGEPVSVYLELLRYVDIYDSSGSILDPYYMDWVTDPKRSGGGELMNFGCYAVDFVRALARSPVRSVFAQTTSSFYPLHKEKGVEDFGQITILFENGFLSHLVAGRLPMLADSNLLRVFCKGGYLLSAGKRKLTKVAGLKKTTFNLPAVDPTQKMISHFVDCVQGKSQPIASVEDGYEETRILQAAYESAQLKRSVALGPQ